VLNGAGDGEVGLLAGSGCARHGKRQRSDGGDQSPCTSKQRLEADNGPPGTSLTPLCGS